MIVVTGAAGFIGSCLVSQLNQAGFEDLILVDDFSFAEKAANLEGKIYKKKVERDLFHAWLMAYAREVDFIFHLGARTDTTEQDRGIFDQLNLNYSKTVWNACVQYQIPLVYASSAATYGAGEQGYDDDESKIAQLKPLNPYGDSKNDFDIWLKQQEETPPFWAGLKFFNVYGPNEFHKGRMASVIFHAFRQIKETGGMKLFRSHRSDFKDGQQQRDFIYVKDVVKACLFLMHYPTQSGIYNLGTGKARTFLDLTTNTFKGMGLSPNISFIDTPEDIRDTYQYFTEANMKKFMDLGYQESFYSLEEGVEDYVKNYLIPGKYF